jgi:hypothetical protein
MGTLESYTKILSNGTHIVPEARGCSWVCGRVEYFAVETALELLMLGWMPFSLNGNGLPRPLEYSSEGWRVTECPLPAPPRPPRVGLPLLPGLALKSVDSLLAPLYITHLQWMGKIQHH